MKRIWRYIYIQWPTKMPPFRLPAWKHGEAASWFRSDYKLEVIYVTIQFLHANSLGKLLLTSIRHTALQRYTHLSGLLCMCGKLAEVLASKCCLTDSCSQTRDKPFKDYRCWQCNQQKARGLKALLKHTLIASLFPFLPTYVHLLLLTYILKT